MSLQFTKMHGLGNDFMVIDAINQRIKPLTPQAISSLANRNIGVGFDQLLLIEPSHDPHVDFFYRIFNADGQEVGQCGNGARCLALYAQHYGLTNKNDIRIATHTTQMHLIINEDQTVTVDFGQPQLSPETIPLLHHEQQSLYEIGTINNQVIKVHAVNVGNPHAIYVVEDIQQAPVATLGKLISLHADFPQQTNAGFMEIVSNNHINLRVYERGCGETLACGSGAVAAAAAAHLFHGLDKAIRVSLPGGDLMITWPDVEKAIYLTGPGTFVYEGALLCEL